MIIEINWVLVLIKKILSGEIKKCYVVCYDSGGTKLEKERKLTINDCILDLVGGIKNIGADYNNLSIEIEQKYVNFLN